MYGKRQHFSLRTHHSMSSTKSLRSIEALRSTLRQHSYFFLQYSLTGVSTNRIRHKSGNAGSPSLPALESMTRLTSWQDSWCILDTATCLSIAQMSTDPWDFDRLADRLPYTHFPPFAHCFHVQALLSYLSQSSSVPGPSSMRLEGSTTIDRATSVRKHRTGVEERCNTVTFCFPYAGS